MFPVDMLKIPQFKLTHSCQRKRNWKDTYILKKLLNEFFNITQDLLSIQKCMNAIFIFIFSRQYIKIIKFALRNSAIVYYIITVTVTQVQAMSAGFTATL